MKGYLVTDFSSLEVDILSAVETARQCLVDAGFEIIKEVKARYYQREPEVDSGSGVYHWFYFKLDTVLWGQLEINRVIYESGPMTHVTLAVDFDLIQPPTTLLTGTPDENLAYIFDNMIVMDEDRSEVHAWCLAEYDIPELPIMLKSLQGLFKAGHLEDMIGYGRVTSHRVPNGGNSIPLLSLSDFPLDVFRTVHLEVTVDKW